MRQCFTQPCLKPHRMKCKASRHKLKFLQLCSLLTWENHIWWSWLKPKLTFKTLDMAKRTWCITKTCAFTPTHWTRNWINWETTMWRWMILCLYYYLTKWYNNICRSFDNLLKWSYNYHMCGLDLWMFGVYLQKRVFVMVSITIEPTFITYIDMCWYVLYCTLSIILLYECARKWLTTCHTASSSVDQTPPHPLPSQITYGGGHNT